jgi:ankyrin repeat protein
VSTFLNHILDQLHIRTHASRFEALTTLCEQIDACKSYRILDNRSHGWSKYIADKLLPETRYGKSTVELTEVALSCHLLPAAILLRVPGFYEPVINAAISGDEDAHAALRSASDYFGTPLYAAVRSGQYDLVKQLVCSTSLNQSVDKSYCLKGAVQTNDLDMIKLLLELGAQGDDIKFQTALICSVELGNTDAARLLLDYAKACSGNISWALNEGLYQAGLHEHEELVTLLLDNGAHVSGGLDCPIYPIWNDFGSLGSPYVRPGTVELASWAGIDARLRMLLARGANPRHGVLPAIMGDSVGALRFLLLQLTPEQHSDLNWANLMLYAIRTDSNAVLRFLLEDARVVPDLAKAIEQDSACWGRLMNAACETTNVQAFDILVRAGAPVDKAPGGPGKMGWTPMLCAQSSAWPGAEEIINRLRRLGVEPVDVMQTSARDNFLNGSLPDRGGFLVMRMPSTLKIRGFSGENRESWKNWRNSYRWV